MALMPATNFKFLDYDNRPPLNILLFSNPDLEGGERAGGIYMTTESLVSTVLLYRAS